MIITKNGQSQLIKGEKRAEYVSGVGKEKQQKGMLLALYAEKEITLPEESEKGGLTAQRERLKESAIFVIIRLKLDIKCARSIIK